MKNQIKHLPLVAANAPPASRFRVPTNSALGTTGGSTPDHMKTLCTLMLLLLATLAQAQPTTAGSALHFFNGQYSSVIVNGFGNVAPTNEITIEFWQRVGRVQAQSTLSIFPDDPYNRINVHVPFADGVVYWDFGNSSGAGRLAYTPPAPMVGTWQHFAFVASQSGNYMAIYRNGVQEAYQTGMTPFVPYNADLTLGTLLDYGLYFCGDLDEVRIWNVARSQSAIQSTMHRPLVGNEPGLVAYWRLDEGSGTITADATGNGNAGTLVNAPVWVFSTAPLSVPAAALMGPNPLTNECHALFLDPGATGIAPPFSMAAGDAYGLALKADGTVVQWGDDYYGHYFVTNFPPPVTNVIAIAAGTGGQALALKADGTVAGWGNDTYGQANPPANATNLVAIAAGSLFSLGLTANGTVIGWGDFVVNYFNSGSAQNYVPASATNIVAIAANLTSAAGSVGMALRSDGTVLQWGPDAYGEFQVTNLPPPATGVVAIAVQEGTGLALRDDGTVVQWQNSYSYAPGGETFSMPFVYPNVTNAIAIAVATAYDAGTVTSVGIIVNADGTVVAPQLYPYEASYPPASVTNAVAISTCRRLILVLEADGTVVGWNENDDSTNAPCAIDSIGSSRSGFFDTNTPGSYQLAYTASNLFDVQSAPATRTLVVVDTTPPTVTLLGPNLMSLVAGTSFVDPGATASDLCAGDLTGSIQAIGAVNNAVPGNYTLLYAATDPSGNVGTTNRTVWVIPAQPYPTSTAPLSGDVNPNGLDTLVYFQYGLTTSYGSSTTPQDIGSGTSPVPFNATITGLLPGTTYHYRLVSTNSNGTVYGPDMTFTTSPYLVPGDLNGDGTVDQYELDVVLSNYWAANPLLVMTNTAGLGATNVQFSLMPTNFWDLTVQVSTNLLDWNVLTLSHPLYQFVDPAASNSPVRFYRLRWP